MLSKRERNILEYAGIVLALVAILLAAYSAGQELQQLRIENFNLEQQVEQQDLYIHSLLGQ